MAVETYRFEDDGGIPNSPLPVLVFHDIGPAHDASTCKALFAGHGWLGAWRDGIFSFHHFHSTAHEVLTNIGAVPLPQSDPVHGPDGPLRQLWRAEG